MHKIGKLFWNGKIAEGGHLFAGIDNGEGHTGADALFNVLPKPPQTTDGVALLEDCH